MMDDYLPILAQIDKNWMHAPFFEGELFGRSVIISTWKLIGWAGVAMFGSRWIVQFAASKKHKRVTMPRAFWIMSVLGSVMLLSYFTFGKVDSVGVLSNLFPCFVAFYNLALDLKQGPKKLDA